MQSSGLNKINIIKLRGKIFSTSEIILIKKITHKYYEMGRTVISREVCKELLWFQPNGWLKDRACRDVLRVLHDKKLIDLPDSKTLKRKQSHRSINLKIRIENKINLCKECPSNFSFDKIRFVMVKGSKVEKQWNEIVNEFHYLGFTQFVGRSLKYLIFHEDLIVGAIGFCDPAWSVTCRDNYIKERYGFSKIEIRTLGINNGRFLILPWIKIQNLASFVLSKSIKLVMRDWKDYYNIKPCYIETFVDSIKFNGTCYKASNWTKIGITKGYKKSGSLYCNSQVPKYVFIYPLT